MVRESGRRGRFNFLRISMYVFEKDKLNEKSKTIYTVPWLVV